MPFAIAILGLAAGLFGLAIDAWQIFPATMTMSATNAVARSFPDAFLYFWTYFTHLTNLGLLLTYAAALTGWSWLGWFRRTVTRAAMAAFILLVTLYYHFMLAPYIEMTGWLLVASILLHYVAPLLYLAWWALGTPHGQLRLADIPMILVPGIAYVAWVLLRGAVTTEYPYDILDAGKFGYPQVAGGVLALFLAVVVFALLLIGADRLLARWRPTPTP